MWTFIALNGPLSKFGDYLGIITLYTIFLTTIYFLVTRHDDSVIKNFVKEDGLIDLWLKVRKKKLKEELEK